jgi:hypothetical protein
MSAPPSWMIETVDAETRCGPFEAPSGVVWAVVRVVPTGERHVVELDENGDWWAVGAARYSWGLADARGLAMLWSCMRQEWVASWPVRPS